MNKYRYIILSLFISIILISCSNHSYLLSDALRRAGDNRHQLELVLEHYRNDAEKFAAARFIIENMPGHYSYYGENIFDYYKQALEVVSDKNMSPDQQRDSLRTLSTEEYPLLEFRTIQDVKIITADFLIYSIDHAYDQWKTRPWAQHLNFDQFCEYLLPYKFRELQSLDYWRDTLANHFSDNLKQMEPSDERSFTAYGALETMRNEIVYKVNPILRWTDYGGYPLLSASTMPYMTTGSCLDYVTMGASAFRSVGLPVVMDYVPLWGRNHEGHSWYVLLNDRGMEFPAPNDITTSPGWGFYPYERFPKVFRSTYSHNKRIIEYNKKSKYRLKFNMFMTDVTDKYFKTSDLDIDVFDNIHLKDKYVYIAMFSVNEANKWYILDFGEMHRGKAHFEKMGRNMLYLVFGYDGKKILPISYPFILHKSGNVEYIKFDDSEMRSVTLKRKYYQSANVLYMRRRLKGAQVQASNYSDFRKIDTMYTIENIYVPDKLPISTQKSYRYWRYLSPDDSYGSIAELSFFNEQDNEIEGQHIACQKATFFEMERAYDNNLLSNFEADSTSGIWVGMDFGMPVKISGVRVIPRSDDNDVCVGNEYELFYMDAHSNWSSLGKKNAVANYVTYNNVPQNALLWLKNNTRGINERPFIMDQNGKITWW
ncbi:MAG: hypothetical protein MJY71_01610 [Bacteroidaceae bacterium]|nr:hypothetical protein [Bacteroidaceae bacterium]